MMNLRDHAFTILAAFVTVALGATWFADEQGWLDIDFPFESFAFLIASVVALIVAIVSFIANKDGDSSQSQTTESKNRASLIEGMYQNWIVGFLEDALKNAFFELSVRLVNDKAGDNALYAEYELGTGDANDARYLTPEHLVKLFDDNNGKLLFLGAPGSGKTILVLQLAQQLLKRAKDSNAPIPVIVNLSSWGADAKPSLADWLEGELQRNFGIPKKLAQSYIAGDNLIFILDGLDEVAQEHQGACLQAINRFMTPQRRLVVCCRSEEYKILMADVGALNVHNSIELAPLTLAQMQYLLREKLDDATVQKIITTLESDDALLQEVKKPLFINILISTYQGGRPFAPDAVTGDAIAKIQKLVIEPYVNEQLRNVTDAPYSNDDTRRHLAWIAHNLKRLDEQVFYVEMLQKEWLPNVELIQKHFFLKFLILTLYLSIFWGTLIEWLANVQLNFDNSLIRLVLVARILTIILLILHGLLSSLDPIDIQKKIIITIDSLKKSIIPIFFSTIFLTISAGFWITSAISEEAGIITAITTGLGGIFIMLPLSGFSERTIIVQRPIINEGLRDTIKFVLVVSFMTAIFASLISGYNASLDFGQASGLRIGIIHGVVSAFCLSGIVSSASGLGDVKRHLLLRWMLQRRNLAPQNFRNFLPYAVERRLMRRVGGSVLFIHRYLLEYFAQEWQGRYQGEFE